MSQTAQTSTRDALWAGCRDAVGVPAAVLVAGMIGFGALGHASGLSIGLTTATSFFIYALPGQVVFVEMVALGASGFAVALAAALTAARFLPMTLTLLPQIPKEDRRRSMYASAHFISMTSWAVMMRDFAHIRASQRMAYFTGFGMTCWAVSTPATMLGYLLAGHVPTPVTIGLVMLNPLFFLLSFTEVRARASRLALLIGGLSGPIVYSWAPGWSILICGLIGGTAAFFLDLALGKKN
ncbi:MAG: AzlC family ABC transporter permease [Betaproteobacteria bacterium]|jgi:predicted branched-subunit amino acid permease|nr:AzlC family ABC transporter permease [Betaproteobacteria bacterium]